MHIAGKAIANFNGMACSFNYNYLEGNEDELGNEDNNKYDEDDEDDEMDKGFDQFFAPDYIEEE